MKTTDQPTPSPDEVRICENLLKYQTLSPTQLQLKTVIFYNYVFIRTLDGLVARCVIEEVPDRTDPGFFLYRFNLNS